MRACDLQLALLTPLGLLQFFLQLLQTGDAHLQLTHKAPELPRADDRAARGRFFLAAG